METAWLQDMLDYRFSSIFCPLGLQDSCNIFFPPFQLVGLFINRNSVELIKPFKDMKIRNFSYLPRITRRICGGKRSQPTLNLLSYSSEGLIGDPQNTLIIFAQYKETWREKCSFGPFLCGQCVPTRTRVTAKRRMSP